MALESFFAILLDRLQARIKQQVPEIRWIDQDLGQLEWYDVRPSVSFPCVLVDFNNTSYDQMQGNEQWGNLVFTLRLGFPAFSPSNNLAPVEVKENALKYYELENLLYQAIQGWDADGLIQAATRTNAATERREEDSHRVRVLTFSTSFQDDTAVNVTEKVDRPLLDLNFEE